LQVSAFRKQCASAIYALVCGCGARHNAAKEIAGDSSQECCKFERHSCVYEGATLPVTEKIIDDLFNDRYEFCRAGTRKILVAPVVGEPPVETSLEVPFARELPKTLFEFYPPDYQNDRCQILVDLRTVSGGYDIYIGHGATELGCIIRAEHEAVDGKAWKIIPIARTEP
jgi:hypothetical protein